MTLTEYIAKDGNSRSAVGSVILTPEECMVQSDWLYRSPMLELRAVTVHMFNYVYVQKSTGNTLWTMDDHGNPKARSVFSLPHNHKHNIDGSAI